MAGNGRPLVVSVVVADGLVGSFGLGVCAEVFGYDRRAMGLPRFDFALVTEAPGVLRTDTGIPITVEHGLERLARSDIVSITAWELFDRVPSPALLDAFRAAHARGAIIVSHCTGAFVLAEAGLLDGKRVTTHWKYAGELAARFPAVQVDPSVLYVDNGQVITGAGTAAGVDTLLHLVRREWGAAAANALAREMVVPPHRDGGQAQYVEAPVPRTSEAPTLEPLLESMIKSLDQPHTVESLAAQAHMSPRTFARRFKAETGGTPHDWLTAQRVLLARRLLEDTDLSVDAIALRAGFGNAPTLRHHFTRRVGATPQLYRATFRCRDEPGCAPAA
jgi:transcriptional regulator GlxA family with amidase domain